MSSPERARVQKEREAKAADPEAVREEAERKLAEEQANLLARLARLQAEQDRLKKEKAEGKTKHWSSGEGGDTSKEMVESERLRDESGSPVQEADGGDEAEGAEPPRRGKPAAQISPMDAHSAAKNGGTASRGDESDESAGRRIAPKDIFACSDRNQITTGRANGNLAAKGSKPLPTIRGQSKKQAPAGVITLLCSAFWGLRLCFKCRGKGRRQPI